MDNTTNEFYPTHLFLQDGTTDRLSSVETTEKRRAAGRRRKGIKLGPMMWITNSSQSVMIRPNVDIPIGWRRGRHNNGHRGLKRSDESRLKMSLSAQARRATDETKKKISITKSKCVWVNNGFVSKHVPVNEIPIGWVRGRIIKHRP